MLLLSLALLLLVNVASASVVQLDIQRNRPLHHPFLSDRDHLGRRQVSQTLDNLRNLYFANITLGTPPQKLRMHIDTGSSDLWCNSPKSTLCSTRLRNCAASGTYDFTTSSTYTLLNNNFSINYMDGTGALGNYVTDTIGFGGQSIPAFQFGVGLRSTSTEGVLGIGYASNEIQVRRGNGIPYPNLPQRLVDDGLIKSNAYSLWLNDLDANTGQILFGGINTEKYHGSLQTVPVLKAEGKYTEFLIALSSVALSGTKISPTNLPVAVLLDSGTTLMYLPDELARSIHKQVNAVTDTMSGGGVAYVPCALGREDRALELVFSGIPISVPFNELVLPSTRSDGSGLRFQDGTPACVFGIAPNGGGVSVLGDTFLRSAYVVYDLVNNQISMAPTNFNATTDNIKEIAPGPAGVPDATMVPSPAVRVKGVGTGAARLAVVAAPTGSVVLEESGATQGNVAIWLMALMMVSMVLSL